MAAADRIARLSAEERWMADARAVAAPAGGYMVREVEMTRAAAWVEALRASGAPGALHHLVVRAAALALARNPAVHQIVCGYERLVPAAVDVGLAMSESSPAPVVIEGASERALPALIEVVDAAIAAGPSEARSFAGLRWFGWLAPFGFLRRLWLRWLQGRFWFRRRMAGTFQVTFAPAADMVVPMRFLTGSTLGVGRVREVVAPVDGRLQVRRVMTMTLAADHVAMDGVRMATLLNDIA